MKNTMSEDTSLKGMTKEQEDEEILTVSIFNNNEDIESLKARLKDVSFQQNDSDEEDGRFLSTESFPGTQENKSPGLTNSEDENQCISDYSVENDSLCLSTETLIDSLDVISSMKSTSQSHEESSRKSKLTVHRHMFESHSDSYIGHSNNMVTMSTTKVTSGLLISPSSLTQDVHITMKEDKHRMSAVLDSLDLHLVYIPGTQQLVARKTESDYPAVNLNGATDTCERNGKSDETETDSSGYVSSGHCTLIKSSSSPVKMSDSSSSKNIQFLSSGTLDDSSSVNESDCLIHIKEPDEGSCDNSDFVCNFPRTGTNDSLLRTFTDASSLSSLSTGTDFSVSAASLDDGEGTGHCIDTGDGGFMEINLHSRNSFERKNPSLDSGFEDKHSKPKRRGLTGILSRYCCFKICNLIKIGKVEV
jgi:hypothetical protein